MTDSPGDKFIQEQPSKAINVREAMNQQFNMTTVRPCVLQLLHNCMRLGLAGTLRKKRGFVK